ncbi:MAG: polysaccharide biosynthesis/export family protein, partial [Prevotella sp.]|nr:polysaccharide biosynthesis/export family protein [Prevotella sp.]
MKRFLYLFILSLLSMNTLFAQMSDNQIIDYIKTESGKGTSQQAIATELMKRGVSQDQLLRIKNQADQQNAQSQSSNLINNALRSNESEGETTNQQTSKSNIFGKNIFNQKNLTFTPNVNIPTPENYKLGTGDEVIINIWGASQASLIQTISPEGSIIVDRIGPIFLNGMTIKEANNFVQHKFASVYSGVSTDEGSSQIKLTLGQIRTIQINVMGEVAVPGTYSISSL